MNYEESIKLIESFIPDKSAKWNKNFGLSKILFLLNKVGNPHLGMKYVHVGGTAGKGSTASFIASILQSSGYKTGLHLSPHIIDIRERAQINFEFIPKDLFIKFVEYLKPVVRSMTEEFGTPPSYFEILLTIAFLYFKEEKTDINVIEVGLGGKLDSTNVIDSKYQIITNIGLDHTAILGNTKELILKDKQEIIKLNSKVISAIKEKYLQEIIKAKASLTNSQIAFLDEDLKTSNIRETLSKSNIYDLEFGNKKIKNIEIKLHGDFQIKNSSLAVATALNMQSEFPDITEDTIRKGILNTKSIGRFDIRSEEPLIIFDGAHNYDKISALISSIKAIYPNKKFITVFRFKRRDDIYKSLELISQISDKLIITGSQVSGDMGLDESYDEQDLANLNNKFEFEAIYDSKEALNFAKNYQSKHPDLGILATGSFFMLRELYEVRG